MLVVGIRLHLKGHRPSIQFYADDRGTQTESRGELDPTIASSLAVNFEHDAVVCLAILKFHRHSTNGHVMNCKISPVRWNVRSQRDLMLFRIGLQPEHSAKDRADN